MNFWKLLKVVTLVVPVVEGVYWVVRKGVREVREAFGHQYTSPSKKEEVEE